MLFQLFLHFGGIPTCLKQIFAIIYIYIYTSTHAQILKEPHVCISIHIYKCIYTKAKVYIPMFKQNKSPDALEDGPDGLTSRELSKDLSNRVRRGSSLGRIT